MRARILAEQLMNGCKYCKMDVNEDGDAFFNCSSESSPEHFKEVGFDDICTRADEMVCPFIKHIEIQKSNKKFDL